MDPEAQRRRDEDDARRGIPTNDPRANALLPRSNPASPYYQRPEEPASSPPFQTFGSSRDHWTASPVAPTTSGSPAKSSGGGLAVLALVVLVGYGLLTSSGRGPGTATSAGTGAPTGTHIESADAPSGGSGQPLVPEPGHGDRDDGEAKDEAVAYAQGSQLPQGAENGPTEEATPKTQTFQRPTDVAGMANAVMGPWTCEDGRPCVLDLSTTPEGILTGRLSETLRNGARVRATLEGKIADDLELRLASTGFEVLSAPDSIPAQAIEYDLPSLRITLTVDGRLHAFGWWRKGHGGSTQAFVLRR